MTALVVIVIFDVVSDDVACAVTGKEDFIIEQFLFEAGEETFGDSVDAPMFVKRLEEPTFWVVL